ncbi:tetratricopeptide repeat protein [Bacteroidota bacterium]
MNSKNIVWIFSIALSIIACNPERHQMPITTSSKEAMELFIKGREIAEPIRTPESDSLFNLAIQLDPKFALAHSFLTTNTGLHKAKQLINQVSPGEALLIKAWDASNAGDLICLEMIDSLVILYPKDKHCLFHAGLMWYHQDEKKAINYFRKAIKLDKYYAPPKKLLAYLLMNNNKFIEAEENFLLFLDLRPNSADAMDSYGDLLVKRGREDRALIQFSMAQKMFPGSSYFNRKIAWIYIRQEKFEQARKFCEDLFEDAVSFRDKEIALNLIGSILFIQGDLSGALDVTDQLIELFKDKGVFYKVGYYTHIKGWYAMLGDQPNQALTFFSKVPEIARSKEMENNEKSILIMYAYGCQSILHAQEGDIIKAGNYLNKARTISGNVDNTAQAQNYMRIYEAIYAMHKGDYKLAITHAKLPADLRYVFAYYYLAKAYDLDGNKEQAIQYYTKTIQSSQYVVSGILYNKSKKRLEELSQ